ncbi:MAG: hypothetical protein J7K40_08445 [candidate division Zixibacteria bacterium]|nr:hypothetical protein [candidate division Zixibacteria bacterium]
MTSEITPLQKRKIKEMVDEIIVNRGILSIADRRMQIDGLNIEQLSSLAFKYYKMIVLGESPFDIDQRLISKASKSSKSQKPISLHKCIGCSSQLDDDDIKSRIPVCKTCRKIIRVDYEILKELFY